VIQFFECKKDAQGLSIPILERRMARYLSRSKRSKRVEERAGEQLIAVSTKRWILDDLMRAVSS